MKRAIIGAILTSTISITSANAVIESNENNTFSWPQLVQESAIRCVYTTIQEGMMQQGATIGGAIKYSEKNCMGLVNMMLDTARIPLKDRRVVTRIWAFLIIKSALTALNPNLTFDWPDVLPDELTAEEREAAQIAESQRIWDSFVHIDGKGYVK
jgi:hypothetical protein